MFYLERGHRRLVSRRGNTFTRFQPLADALARELDGQRLILDAEVVILDDQGRSQFNPPLRRDTAPVL